MGQEIVYCVKCQNRLIGSDFERGKAFKIGSKVSCFDCALELLSDFPDPQAERERMKRAVVRGGGNSSITSSQLKVQRPESPSSPRIPAATHRLPVAEPAPRSSSTPLWIGIGAVGAAIILGFAIALSGSGSRSRSGMHPGDEAAAPVTPPRPSPGAFVPPPRPAPKPEKTLKDELAELDAQIRPLAEQGQIRDASTVLEAAHDRHPEPEWTRGLETRLASLQADGRRRTAPLFERAVAAARRGDTAQVQSLRSAVELQSTRGILGEFDRAVTGVVVTVEPERKPSPPVPAPAPAPSPAPPAPPPASALDAYRADWARAASLAASRNLPAAIRELEKSASGQKDPAALKEAQTDLGDLKLVAEALAELPKLAPRLSKGQKITLQFLGETGSLESTEGTIFMADATRVALQVGPGMLEVPVGELGGSTIATLLGLRGEKHPGDARASALIAALDGHKIPELGEKFSALRRETPSEELEARQQFFTAEAELAEPRTRSLAAAGFSALLDKQSSTAFVTRDRRFIEERLLELRDFLFFAEDLAGAGSFGPASNSRGETSWQSGYDSPPDRLTKNWLEAELFVQPGLTYHGWVYAGGCCQEVLTFSVQGTGLTGPSAKNPRESAAAEPGSEESLFVRPPSLGLKKKHSDHLGPKTAEKWEWIPLGPLKFASPGSKKLRLLTDQRGFSVGCLIVSATRTGPPREIELKELQKARPPADLGATSQIYREIFRDVPGGAVSDLVDSQKFKENKADMVGMVSALDSWNMGENYGCRMRGYVHPPVTGEYTFWIAADDQGELWLSSDDTPIRKSRICGVNHPVGQRDWGADPSQKSAPVALVAGKRYYIEALQKQGAGSEHVAVGWTLPGGRDERPIPPSRLSAWGAFPPRRAPRILARSLSPDSPVAKTASVGGGGGRAFDESPLPRLFLRGFRYTLADRGSVASLQALYGGAGGTSEGALWGQRKGGEQELVGRPGYVVGGWIARGTERLAAFRVIWMRLSGDHLLPYDHYESDWIGGCEEGAPVQMAGDGTPVLGLFGRADAEVDAAGLVIQAK